MKRILTWILALVLAAACCVPAMAEECSHIWKTVEPTCVKDGRKLCTICGVNEVLPATGAHDMKISKEPTCAEEGEKTCTVCGYPEKIAKTGNHTWKTVDATCGKDGRKLCTVCGVDEVLPATGAHDMKVTSEPTCAKEGEKTCSVCGCKEAIAKTETHTWKTVEPTCGKEGRRLCTVCGKSETLPATGEHDWIIKDASCEAEGKKLCSKCGVGEVIPAKGHDWYVGKEPTCTEPGDRVCVVCDESEVLKANGHKPVVIPAVEATCKKEGSTEGAFCEVCGVMLTEPQKIPAKKHSYYYRIVEPTADKSGYMLHICRNCGRQYSTDRVEALGQGNNHIYGIVTDVDRVVKDYTLNTAGGIAVIKAAAEADGMFATRCLFLSEETVQKLVQAGCSEVRFAVGSASVSFPLNALGSETVVVTLSIEDDSIGVKATIDNEAAQDVTEKLEGLTLTISDAENTALATESGRAYDATFENGVWTIKAAAAETYILTTAK